MPRSPSPSVSWERDLNERQRAYLLALYERDQTEEAYQRTAWSHGARALPADEWRWIYYGEMESGPSPLKRALLSAGLVDQGTGATFEALRARGLVLVRSHRSPYRGGDHPVHLRMTTAGRKLARVATGEVREKKQPAGTLREWHWRALALLYRAGGLQSEMWGDGRYHPIDTDPATWEYRDGVRWETVERLRDYKWGALAKEHFYRGGPAIEVTPFGRQYYEREWVRYRGLYPDVDAPEPKTANEG